MNRPAAGTLRQALMYSEHHVLIIIIIKYNLNYHPPWMQHDADHSTVAGRGCSWPYIYECCLMNVTILITNIIYVLIKIMKKQQLTEIKSCISNVFIILHFRVYLIGNIF